MNTALEFINSLSSAAGQKGDQNKNHQQGVFLYIITQRIITRNVKLTCAVEVYVKAWLNQETLLRKHCCGCKCFPIQPRRKHVLRKQILLLGNKKCFCHGVKNIFVSRTQILCPKHMFPNLATPGKHNTKHCFRNNFSQFSQALTLHALF